MKTILIQNMLTGFPTEQAARNAAESLTKGEGNISAAYHDADREPNGELTMYSGFGHCVLLVIEVDDNAKLIAYHEKEILYLVGAERDATASESKEHHAGHRKMSDLHGEVRAALDNALHYHRAILAELGVKQ